MAATTHPASSSGGMRLQVQRFGTFLSNMVLPNIGAFIAWGLITALVIETGWIHLVGSDSSATTAATAWSRSSGTGVPTPRTPTAASSAR